MNYSLSSDHIQISEVDKELIGKKIDRLEKYISEPYVLDVRIKHDTHHKEGRVVSCTMNLENGGNVFHAERSEGSVQDAVDRCIEAIKQNAQKEHGKRSDH